MKRYYESPELEINIFSLNTCVLAAASNSVTEDAGEDNKDNQGDGDGWDPLFN